MKKLTITIALLFSFAFAYEDAEAQILDTFCYNCEAGNLRQMAIWGATHINTMNYGSSMLSRIIIPGQIWVENFAGEHVLVTLTTPTNETCFLGWCISLPEYWNSEVNAVRADGSESLTETLPNEIISAQSMATEAAYEHDDGPDDDGHEITAAEWDELPDFNLDVNLWEVITGTLGTTGSTILSFSSQWLFTSTLGTSTGIMRVDECAYSDAC